MTDRNGLTQSWALGLASNMQALPDAPPAKAETGSGEESVSLS